MGDYIKLKLHGGGCYTHPLDQLHEAICGELDGVFKGESITLTLEKVELTDEQYEALPEFTGH